MMGEKKRRSVRGEQAVEEKVVEEVSQAYQRIP